MENEKLKIQNNTLTQISKNTDIFLHDLQLTSYFKALTSYSSKFRNDLTFVEPSITQLLKDTNDDVNEIVQTLSLERSNLVFVCV